jgi:hypothetical protein
MNASVSGRESLNGAAEPGRDLLEGDVFDGTKAVRAKNRCNTSRLETVDRTFIHFLKLFGPLSFLIASALRRMPREVPCSRTPPPSSGLTSSPAPRMPRAVARGIRQIFCLSVPWDQLRGCLSYLSPLSSRTGWGVFSTFAPDLSSAHGQPRTQTARSEWFLCSTAKPATRSHQRRSSATSASALSATTAVQRIRRHECAPCRSAISSSAKSRSPDWAMRACHQPGGPAPAPGLPGRQP